MKIKLIPGIVFVLVLLAFAYAYYLYTEQVDIGERVVTIIIKPGDTLSKIADRLVNEGVVESRAMLVYPARIVNLDRKLTPGRYDFTGKNSCRSVLNILDRADFVRIKITVPEGATIWQVASIVSGKLELDSAKFVKLNTDSTFLAEHELPGLEGFLFPETYYFPWGMSETEVATEMVDMFRRLTADLTFESAEGDLSKYDVVKLASIIEAETGLIDERRLVSSVYHNRLSNKMKLDADPTVIYGLGGLKRPLYSNDLRKDTPYNTYLHRGLPPTPINSPGLASIEAAIDPEESDYYYFVAADSGRHIFSRTNAEHNRAKERVKALKNQH